jgi:uncharacterized protein (DUF1800 family)
VLSRGVEREAGESALEGAAALRPAASGANGVVTLPTWLVGQPTAEQTPGAVSDTPAVVHLLRRATFGVRPEDVSAVLSMGADAWLEAQLHPERITDAGVAPRLSAYPAASASVAELIREYTPPRPQPGDTTRRQMTPAERRAAQQRNPQRILLDLVGAKLVRSVWSERQLEEVMTDFWYNHFNVFFGKGLDRYLVADYERTAIRPYVFGRFEDMLRATAQHPAMLFYLDNWTSAVPDSLNPDAAARQRQAALRLRSLLELSEAQRAALVRSGRLTAQVQARLDELAQLGPAEREAALSQLRRGDNRGINENYARELMELHTLGVDGGYTQQDVVEVARALTGWTFVRPGQRGARPARTPERQRRGMDAPAELTPRFVFNADMHDRGEKVVLGTRLPAGRGVEDGLDVIHMLATHPSTAKFLSTKLIERFVSDRADPAFVDELAAVFTRTGGDLREVTRALFSSPRFYASGNAGTKVKTPFELVASALRVTGAEIVQPRATMEVLRGLGQLPYSETAPTGFPASSDEWVNSGALLARMNFGLNLASGRVAGVRPDGARLSGGLREAGTRTGEAGRAIADVLQRLLPGVETARLQTAILADVQEQAAAGETTARALGMRAVGLALGSPEFQRR